MGFANKGNGFVWDVALKESLSLNHERVSIIRCNAGSGLFITWFHISCYFPVFTACLGPIANTISIACVVERWRLTRIFENGIQIGVHSFKDPAGIFAFNVISLVLGFMSNIVLLLHFSERLSYLKAQCICILGWTTASFMLLIDVIVCGTRYFDENHEKSIGFWYAVITSGLYFGCTITLTTHFIGYLLGVYPPRFNLIKNERSLMVFTVSFSIILIWGGVMFSKLLHLSFGNSLYFCVVSVLTIGLGDILPSSDATRILILVYSYLGVVNLALIVAMTTGIIKNAGSSVVFFHQVEAFREKELTRLNNHEVTYTSEEAFNKMVEIRKRALSRKRIHSLLSVLFAFIIFWNLGSLGLKFAENWSYFDGIYFCFLCLITIGYGDYAPASGAGRAFFVLWVLGAVPLMSAIISTVGDILLDLSDSLDLSIANRFRPGLQGIMIYCSRSFQKYVLNTDEILPEDDTDGDDSEENESHNSSSSSDRYPKGATDCYSDVSKVEVRGHGESLPKSPNLNEKTPWNLPRQLFDKNHDEHVLGRLESFNEMRRLVNALREFRFITRQSKNYSLSYKQWNEVKSLNILTRDPNVANDPSFWLSDQSPLRFPMDQPKFVVIRLLTRMEELFKSFFDDEEAYQIHSTKGGLTNLSSKLQKVGELPNRRSIGHRGRSLSI